MRVLAILTVRNEAAFLLEWLAHHKAVGFSDFLVFSNDCQDGTDAMLDRLQKLGHLTHLRNDGPYDKRGIQFTALNAAAKHDLVRQADWILALDIDEFVNIHAEDRTVPSLLAALPDATAITLTWRLFGNSDVVRYSDTRITESFFRCAPSVIYGPWRAVMFKTLYRNDGTYRKPGVHRPRSADASRLDTVRWFDGHGRELDTRFHKNRLFSDYGRENYGLAQLNHYPLGAMETYVLKTDRGRVNRSDTVSGMDYWVERNFNTDEDRSILKMSDRSEPIRQQLLADATLAELHQGAVAWRQDRFRTLMEEEPYRALLARLLMTPPARPISATSARTLAGFAHMSNARQKNGNAQKD